MISIKNNGKSILSILSQVLGTNKYEEIFPNNILRTNRQLVSKPLKFTSLKFKNWNNHVLSITPNNQRAAKLKINEGIINHLSKIKNNDITDSELFYNDTVRQFRFVLLKKEKVKYGLRHFVNLNSSFKCRRDLSKMKKYPRN